MEILETPLSGVKVLVPKIFSDERGFFLETYRESLFREGVSGKQFVQENHSRSRRGILRGIHLQTKAPQGKLVSVVRGKVFDVAVDLRTTSKSFGSWYGQILDCEKREMMWVPEGFGHAFVVLSEEADFVYKCTRYYDPTSEISIAYDDPHISIDWPIEETEITVSSKDKEGVSLRQFERDHA